MSGLGGLIVGILSMVPLCSIILYSWQTDGFATWVYNRRHADRTRLDEVHKERLAWVESFEGHLRKTGIGELFTSIYTAHSYAWMSTEPELRDAAYTKHWHQRKNEKLFQDMAARFYVVDDHADVFRVDLPGSGTEAIITGL